MVCRSRRGSAQMPQISSSVRVWQCWQWPTSAIADCSACARRLPPSRFRSRIWKAMRCADFGPTPGNMRKASTSWSIRGLNFFDMPAIDVLERHLEAGRYVQTGSQSGQQILAVGLDAAHGVVDGGSEQVFQHFLVLAQQRWVDGHALDVV